MSSPVDWRVGANILQARGAARISRRVLAGRLGITVDELIRIESGATRVPPLRLAHVADVLGVTVVSLFRALPPCQHNEVRS